MRKLNLADAFRLSRLLAKANAKEVVANALKTGQKAAAERREMLLNLKKQYDTAPAGAEKNDIARRLNIALKDDSAMYAIGIDAAVELLDCAAAQGVEDEVYRFLSPVTGIPEVEIAEMPLDKFAGMLRELMAANNMKNFFTSPPGTSAPSSTDSTADTGK